MFDLPAVQAALNESGFDGWLLYDFRGSNVLARRVLGLESQPPGSRRWLYFIPAEGSPRKLVHRIEPGALDSLPGEEIVYLRWQELEAGIAELITGCRSVAMEYSPRNANPYVSRVEAGTVELVRSLGVDVVSSGDLIQRFEALWDDEQWAMHQAAGVQTDSAFGVAWRFIADEVRRAGFTTELAVQRVIMEHFDRHELTTYSPPIVAVNEHSGDPHYETGAAEIREGDFVLIDLWAKLNRPRAVYSDMTRVGFVGETAPEKYRKIFEIVAGRGMRRLNTFAMRLRSAASCTAGRWMTPAEPSSKTPATARSSCTEPVTASARKSTATGPTSTISKPTRNA